jgi:hypothetical protein
VALGGGLDVRAFAAAELYRKRLVKKILVSQVAEGRAAEPGHTEANLLLQYIVHRFGSDYAGGDLKFLQA